MKIWLGKEGGLKGNKRVAEEVTMAKVHCMQAQQCYSVSLCFVRSLCTNKNHNLLWDNSLVLCKDLSLVWF